MIASFTFSALEENTILDPDKDIHLMCLLCPLCDAFWNKIPSSEGNRSPQQLWEAGKVLNLSWTTGPVLASYGRVGRQIFWVGNCEDKLRCNFFSWFSLENSLWPNVNYCSLFKNISWIRKTFIFIGLNEWFNDCLINTSLLLDKSVFFIKYLEWIIQWQM